MAEIVGPPDNVIRNRPITQELHDLLDAAADATGIDRILIASGGQTSDHAPHLKGVVGGWIGSRRHDNGRAADIELTRNGVTLTFTDQGGSAVESFVTAAAARGANGIGAGVNYMGRKRIHVGFGNSPSDHQKLVWGAAGASANAPDWLRRAAREGWDSPVETALMSALAVGGSTGRSSVMAREGLWLRKGPGLGFDRARLLDPGTRLTIVGFDGDWARVDLEDDGLVDGHVFAAFLGSADTSDPDDGVEEPAGEEPRGDAAEARTVADGRASRAKKPSSRRAAPG